MQVDYSEIFYSPQGEGHYTGVPTVWLRLWACNLQCDGFGQESPQLPETYDLPWKDIIATDYNRLEDLPVFKRGCDSSYTWAKKFKHLAHSGTPKEVAGRIVDAMKNDFNPEGKFEHPHSDQEVHMAFTGGEPLLPKNQKAVIAIMQSMMLNGNYPWHVTFETNGTQKLKPEFEQFFSCDWDGELFFSVSPKLFSVSGEKREKAIKPDAVQEYACMECPGQLKFVVGPRKEQWDEMEEVVELFRDKGVTWPVHIMPVGARLEEQELTAGDVARMALERGYIIAPRVHTYLFGNAIGT